MWSRKSWMVFKLTFWRRKFRAADVKEEKRMCFRLVPTQFVVIAF